MEATNNFPYLFTHSDHFFYILSDGSIFPKQCLRINRLTNKNQIISQELYQKQTSETIQKSKNHQFKVCMIMGTIIINQQPYIMLVTNVEPVGYLVKQPIYVIKDLRCLPYKTRFTYEIIDQQENQKILNFIKNDLIYDNFYYCYKEDLTLTRQRLTNCKRDNRYFWNQHLLSTYPQNPIWQIPIMQGFVRELHCQNTYFSFYYLSISRRSKYMCGTRFSNRGIDSNSYASNFVQTEQILICHQWLFSHVGIRGSAPIMWSQATVKADIIFPKESEINNDRLIKKHYDDLYETYGCEIVTVNLLSRGKSPEKQLKNRFEFSYYRAIKGKFIEFDLNEETKDKNHGQTYIDRFIEDNFQNLIGKNNFFCMDRYTNKVLSKQKSIPRVNCLDCIDRTNVVLARIGEGYLKEVQKFINLNVTLQQKKLHLLKQFEESVIQIWSQLGDTISMMYCGTESVATHLTKKQNNSFMSFLTGGIKSINRYYNATVNDTFKQQCIEFFLMNDVKNKSVRQQNLPTLSPYFQDNIVEGILQQSDFSDYSEFGIYVLTWNCNMVDPQRLMDSKDDRLFWFHEDDVDMVVVCLQEMVELSSYNVLLGNNETIVSKWQKYLQKSLNTKRTHKNYQYLIGYDLVGICTIVFIEQKMKQIITQSIEQQEIKTGFNGSLGNKGAIFTFMQLNSTKITLINCHLAAGETNNAQRYQDIAYIHQSAIKDRHKRRLLDRSQFRFFIGDMNFRLEAKNQNVREVLYGIEKEQENSKVKLTKAQINTLLQVLLQKDEMKLCQNQHPVLSHYNEPEIGFLPTYKFVKKSKQYDNKRVPSWCDRILYYSKQNLKISSLKYTSVQCYQSDHKPVVGIFRILIKKQNKIKKYKLILQYLKS